MLIVSHQDVYDTAYHLLPQFTEWTLSNVREKSL
jgi:hypothetical protein